MKRKPLYKPLRKIVGYEAGMEVLECGHRQRPVSDAFGETNANRRRCKQCGRELNRSEP